MDKLLTSLRERLSRHLSEKVMRTLRPFLTTQFVTFMGMGIINTFFASLVATVLDTVMHLFLLPSHPVRVFAQSCRSNFITGYVLSIVLSFFLNSKYTFCQKPTFKRFIKFPVSYIPNFLFQYLMVFIFTSHNWNSTAAYIIAAILGTPVTFIAMRLMVFGKKGKDAAAEKPN